MTFSGSDKSNFWIYARRYPEINRLISIFGREHGPPIFIQVRPSCFPSCYEFIWSGNVLIRLKCAAFSLRLSPPGRARSRRHTVMAFYSGSVPANCCVWLASQSMSRQVAGYVLFFCKSKQHKVPETGNFPNWAAGRSQWTTKASLLVREEKQDGGRGGERVREKKTSERVRDENRQQLCLCMCVCVVGPQV